MKRCPECNKPNPDNAKKCFQCKSDISNLQTEMIEQNNIPDKKGIQPDRKKEFAVITKDFFKEGSIKIKKTKRYIIHASIILCLILGILLAIGIESGVLIKISVIIISLITALIIILIGKITSLLTQIYLQQIEIKEKLKEKEKHQ